MAFLLLAGKHSWAITWLSGSREIGQGFKIYRKSFMIWKKKKNANPTVLLSLGGTPYLNVLWNLDFSWRKKTEEQVGLNAQLRKAGWAEAEHPA